MYRRAIKLNPIFFEAYNNLAIIESRGFEISNGKYSKDNFDKVMEIFNKAIEIKPNIALLKYNKLAFSWKIDSNIGTIDENGFYQQKRDYYIKELKSIISKDSTILGSYILLGNILYYKKNFKEAIANYQKALRLINGNGDTETQNRIKFNVGQCYYNLHDFANAEKYYLPSKEENLDWLIRLYFNSKQYKKANEIMDKYPGTSDDCDKIKKIEQKYKNRENFIDDLENFDIDYFRYSLSYLRCLLYFSLGKSFDDCVNERNEYVSNCFLEVEEVSKNDGWVEINSSTLEKLKKLIDEDDHSRCNKIDENLCEIDNWINFTCHIPSFIMDDIFLSKKDNTEEFDSINYHEQILNLFQLYDACYNFKLYFFSELPSYELACPYLYSYSDNNLIFETTIITNKKMKQNEGITEDKLSHFTKKIVIKEVEPETSYLDFIRITGINANGKEITLVPNIPKLEKEDNIYYVLNQNDSIVIDFGKQELRDVFIVAKGYYVPYNCLNR